MTRWALPITLITSGLWKKMAKATGRPSERFEKMEAEGIVSPVVSLSIDYKKPTTFKDEIEISLKVKDLSTLKLSFEYQMKVKGVLVCKATSTHCFISEGRPFSFQEKWPELTEKLLEL